MISPRTRPAAVVVSMALLAGCDYGGPTDLPLPAGGHTGDDPYRVTAIFDDATNLARKGTCRANDVPIGTIESVTLDNGLNARVVCLVNRETRLPGNSVATLSETGLLGERFVAFGPPSGESPRGTLRHGAVLTSHNGVDPNVEQVLGALSAVLNGGSLARVRTITRELNNALDGRETNVKALLEDLATLTGRLNRQRDDITDALDSLDKLSGKLARQRKVIGAAVDAVPEGLQVLNRQRPRLTELLRELARLSDVATPVITRSKRDAVADLKLLRPILAELDNAGEDLAASLKLLPTYPFGSGALAAMQGDYFGLSTTFNLNLDSFAGLLGEYAPRDPGAQGPGSGKAPNLPGLPQLEGVPETGLPAGPALDLGDLMTGGG